MMLFKLLGAVSILLSAAIFYFEGLKYENRKLRQTEGFISLLRYIKKQIGCFSTPINAIISECDKEILSSCGIKEGEWESGTSANLMSDMLDACELCIDGRAIQSLKKFTRDFGKSYREEQIKSCDYYISELEEYRNDIQREIPKQRKIRLALCLCVSVSLILLLI